MPIGLFLFEVACHSYLFLSKNCLCLAKVSSKNTVKHYIAVMWSKTKFDHILLATVNHLGSRFLGFFFFTKKMLLNKLKKVKNAEPNFHFRWIDGWALL